MYRNVTKGQEKIGIRCVNDRRDDIGTWHRAYAVADHLLNAGAWDGEGPIWVADPHKTLADIDLYGKRAADLIRGVDWDYYAPPAPPIPPAPQASPTPPPSWRAEVVEAAVREDKEAEYEAEWWETMIALDDKAQSWIEGQDWLDGFDGDGDYDDNDGDYDDGEWDDAYYRRMAVMWRRLKAIIQRRQAIAAGARPRVVRWALGPNVAVFDGAVYQVIDLTAGGAA